MNERVEKLAKRVLVKTIYPEPKAVEYDPADLFLPDVLLETRRVCEYMKAQDVAIPDEAKLVGQIRFGACPYPTNLFPRTGHKRFAEICGAFYGKPVDNLATFEWQHSTPDYANIVENGFEGLKEKIAASRKKHAGDAEKEQFFDACAMMCDGIIAWEEKCAAACRDAAAKAPDPARRAELAGMADVLDRVPRKPARDFREAIQSVYFCFDFLSDSIGTIDRYLYPFYRRDVGRGALSPDDAKELLQMFFCRIQSFTPTGTHNFIRGGECHFAVGGFLPDGEDGFTDFSQLIVEAMEELPLYIPQISLRWTPKTPFPVLKRLLDLERHDPHKRIAFVNDVPRIEGFISNAGVSKKDAYNYTMVGCNEPALQGGIWLGGITANLAKSIATTLHEHSAECAAAPTFEAFFEVYKTWLFKDLAEILDYEDKFNFARSKDVNVLSSLMLNGCIDSGTTVTRGGSIGITGVETMGLVCVIDSLSIIKQFVYEEKRCTFQTLIDALKADWTGYGDLHNEVLKHGRFFGNRDPLSDGVARLLTTTLWEYFHDKRIALGKRILLGNLAGYNPHYVWFGSRTPATPDGRKAGEAFMVGICQGRGKDRNGLLALLTSVAGFDPKRIYTGPSVTNVNLDAALMKNEESFDKVCRVIETYFKMGGLHIQLNCVSREELVAAKKDPDEYKSLRVRVSGYSDYFVNLDNGQQDEIIARTNLS